MKNKPKTAGIPPELLKYLQSSGPKLVLIMHGISFMYLKEDRTIGFCDLLCRLRWKKIKASEDTKFFNIIDSAFDEALFFINNCNTEEDKLDSLKDNDQYIYYKNILSLNADMLFNEFESKTDAESHTILSQYRLFLYNKIDDHLKIYPNF